MERALDPDLLRLALGESEHLPSSVELADSIAQAEVGLLLGRADENQQLEGLAWYLHSVASARPSLSLYGRDRQRAAFRVSAHILDVLLQSTGQLLEDRAERSFAAQIAYWRSEFSPNSTAVYSRSLRPFIGELRFLEDQPGVVACSVGAALLALDANYLFSVGRSLVDQVADMERLWGSTRLQGTPFACLASVILGVWDLLIFQIYGQRDRVSSAREKLESGITDAGSENDRLSRWVAAHLVGLTEGLERDSIWNVLPPAVPEGVRRAFALGLPRVTTLWPPQIGAIAGAGEAEGDIGLFEDANKRIILSMPTSAGKTLLAQLLIASHLARGRGGVCYVAPTRSLCNEVRSALDRRLRHMDHSVAPDISDFDQLAWILEEHHVEVMTPERLAFLARSDPSGLLERFSLFVFDEAQSIGEGRRGWTLESVLSYIHYATLESEHRILLMSAALGNRHHFVSWLTTSSGGAKSSHSDWRGPRRMHCIWTTSASWGSATTEPRRSTDFPTRRLIPLYGRLVARPTRTGDLIPLTTTEPVGVLAQKVSVGGSVEKETGASTPFYRMLVPLVETLVLSGPVLVIEATRKDTLRMARVIADQRPDQAGGVLELVDLVSARLGEDHPLVDILRHGVAYHHGSLPLDIREAIEDAVRSESIHVLVATTTLTEGVNLPVRSVVIGSQGAYGSGGSFNEYIDGAKLVNAIGRAGRATKETEGVVVLARQAEFSRADYERLDPEIESLSASSFLASAEAMAAFEEASRASLDAAFEDPEAAVQEFLSFVWFLAAERERLDQPVSGEGLREVISRTLAWQQVPDSGQESLLRLADVGLRSFLLTPKSRRQRWARAGTSLRSAAVLESVSEAIAALAVTEETLANPVALVTAILEDGRLARLMSIGEAPSRAVYTTRGGASRQVVDFSKLDLLKAWMTGEEIGDMGNRFFGGVVDDEFRAEQLGDLIGELFETFLPWVLGVLLAWANEIRRELGTPPLPTEAPAYVRWGVDRPECLTMQLRGIRSRRLSHAIATAWRADRSASSESVFSWVRSLSLAEWRTRFHASVAELRSLLECTRPRAGSIAAQVLAGREAEIEVQRSPNASSRSQVEIRRLNDDDPPELGIWAEDELLGVVSSWHLGDISSLVATGLKLAAALDITSDSARLLVSLANPDE